MQIQLPLTVKFTKDKESKDASWVAYTPELDIASCGPTKVKAEKNLHEAVQILLNGAAEDGTLKDLLLESGFEIGDSTIKPPQISHDQFKFDLSPDLAHQVWRV